MNQHEYVTIPDVAKPGKPSSLDATLTRFARDGRRVLDFWRVRREWVIKLMAPQ